MASRERLAEALALLAGGAAIAIAAALAGILIATGLRSGETRALLPGLALAATALLGAWCLASDKCPPLTY